MRGSQCAARFTDFREAAIGPDACLRQGDLLELPGLSNGHTHSIQSGFGLGPNYRSQRFEKWLSSVVLSGQARADFKMAIAALELCILDNLRRGNSEITLQEKGQVISPEFVSEVARLSSQWRVSINLRLGLYDGQISDRGFMSDVIGAVQESRDELERNGGSVGVSPVNLDLVVLSRLKELFETIDLDRNVWHCHFLEAPTEHGVGLLLDGTGGHLDNWELVHCCRATADDLHLLTNAGALIVSCPTSNLFLGVGLPPILDIASPDDWLRIGSDGRSSGGNQDVIDACYLLWLCGCNNLESRIPLPRLLQIATHKPRSGLPHPAVIWEAIEGLPALSTLPYYIATERHAFRFREIRLGNQTYTDAELIQRRRQLWDVVMSLS